LDPGIRQVIVLLWLIKKVPRDGRFIEIVGHYNPRTEPSTIVLKDDRIYYWLSVGAQPTEAVDGLFKQTQLWERYERFKAGEDVDALVEEAEQVYQTGSRIHAPTRHKPVNP
jgi:small subunit ribosomal protein S16